MYFRSFRLCRIETDIDGVGNGRIESMGWVLVVQESLPVRTGQTSRARDTFPVPGRRRFLQTSSVLLKNLPSQSFRVSTRISNYFPLWLIKHCAPRIGNEFEKLWRARFEFANDFVSHCRSLEFTISRWIKKVLKVAFRIYFSIETLYRICKKIDCINEISSVV